MWSMGVWVKSFRFYGGPVHKSVSAFGFHLQFIAACHSDRLFVALPG